MTTQRRPLRWYESLAAMGGVCVVALSVLAVVYLGGEDFRIVVQIIAWWWVMFGAFWLSLGLIVLPWQLMVGNDFDFRHPKRKLRTGVIIATLQLPVVWVCIGWPGTGGWWLNPLTFMAIPACGVLILWVRSWEPEGPDRWDELGAVGWVQPALLSVAGLMLLLEPWR